MRHFIAAYEREHHWALLGDRESVRSFLLNFYLLNTILIIFMACSLTTEHKLIVDFRDLN